MTLEYPQLDRAAQEGRDSVTGAAQERRAHLVRCVEMYEEHGWTDLAAEYRVRLDEVDRLLLFANVAEMQPPLTEGEARGDGGEQVMELREAGLAVIAAVDAYRDAVNGLGHPGEEHNRDLHFDPCPLAPEGHIYDMTGDCSACGGAQYGTEDALTHAHLALRDALGLPRQTWQEYYPSGDELADYIVVMKALR